MSVADTPMRADARRIAQRTSRSSVDALYVVDPLVGLLEWFDRKLAVGGELDGISTVAVVMRPPEGVCQAALA